MTWTITWFDDTTLVLEPVSPYTWDDFHQMIDEASMMIARKTHDVDVIYDLRHEIPLPGAGLLIEERKVHYRTPDNIGWTVLVGARDYTRNVTKTVFKALRSESELHFAKTVEDAITLLEEKNKA